MAHTTALIVSPATEPGQLQHFVLIHKNMLHADTEAGGIQPVLFKDRAQPSLLLLH